MDKYLTNKAYHRISRKQATVGRVSNPSTNPGQNDSFSDEFLTKKPVDSCRSREPGKTSDPMNPMKSIDYNTFEGCPAHPPSGCSFDATSSESTTCEPSRQTGTDFPDGFSDKLTRKPGSMTRKRKRRSSIVEIGNGPARIKIYTMNRRDGYPEFTLAWKEAGRRKIRSFSSMEEARMIAQQTSVRLTNGWIAGDEVTRRDIDLFRHCEQVAREHGVGLAAAMDEWASARKVAGEIPLSDAVRFYQANRADLFAVRTNVQVAAEFVVSLKRKGVSDIYVRNATSSLKRFTDARPGNIADVSMAGC